MGSQAPSTSPGSENAAWTSKRMKGLRGQAANGQGALVRDALDRRPPESGSHRSGLKALRIGGSVS